MSTKPTAPETITCSEGDLSKRSDLRVLHFNDVYHVEPSHADPVGGITRFQSMCNHYRHDPQFQDQPELLAFFSGDGFNPSLESSVTKGVWKADFNAKGSHMIPILNNVPTAAACVGNHDLDLGVHQFEHLASQCNFPWLLANVLDPALGDDVPLGRAEKTAIITSSNGIKIGLIGLVEQEWLEVVNALPPHLIYIDSHIAATQLVPGLRARGAEIVIALCHQRERHDIRLAEETPPGLIDIILGGHDHHYRYTKVKDTHVLCSGSDFKQLSYVEARRRKRPEPDALFLPNKWDIRIIRRDITSAIPEDPNTLGLMDQLFSSLKVKLENPVGYTAVPLDSRFATVRTRESNLGNFVADLMRCYFDTDCAILVGGTIRGDVVYSPGILRLKDIIDCFPFEDPTMVIQVKGKAILQALENGVSHYPALEGRFPQVSNISFVFDPARSPYHRVTSVEVGDGILDLERDYSVATRDYMVNGGDGYSSFMLNIHGCHAVPLVKEENGILLSMLLRQHFMSSMTLGRWKNWSAALRQHWTGVQEHLERTCSIVTGPDSQILSHPSPIANAISSEDRGHVPGLVGKCLRRETLRPQPTPPLFFHDSNLASHEQPLLSPEQPISTPSVIPRIFKSTTGIQEEIELSDSEGEGEVKSFETTTPMTAVTAEPSHEERELQIARRAVRKWWRVAGLRRRSGRDIGFERGEELESTAWTKEICPRVEGRIRMVSWVDDVDR